jgi:Uma2 family endonuclease
MITIKEIEEIEELYKLPENGKAEIINGKIVKMAPTGFLPGRVAGQIYGSLREYERKYKTGYAIPDNVGFIVNLPNRTSFSPDASYYVGNPTGMKFLSGVPIFAVEVRSENDYGDAEEEKMKQKRLDYFASGTKVVWDVDLIGVNTICKYCYDDPNNPVIFRRGDIANAEPALPSWSIVVDELFD